MRRRGWGAVLVAVLGASLVGGCGNGGGDASSGSAADGVPEWPAPDDPMERAAAAGLEPQVRELLQTHRHSHLDVFVDGEPVVVPAAIGIDVTDPGVKRFPGP